MAELESKHNIVVEHHAFDADEINQVKTKYIDEYPIVYILNQGKQSSNRPKAYIGETVNMHNRMRAHLKNKERKILTEVWFIGQEYFNKSATYNIETNLINYFIADGQYTLQNTSQTAQTSMHDYYKKAYYDQDVFEEIWNRLRVEGLAKDTTDTLKNKDIYKLSPFKTLSQSQLELKENILDFCRQVMSQKTKQKHLYLIKGEAGTGKSVVLSSLFNTIQEEARAKGQHGGLHGTKNYLLVNHPEMLKTYEGISEALPHLRKSDFKKPTTFVNKTEDDAADIVLIDEGHLLLSTSDNYNNFKGDNHLDEIMKKAKVVVMIYDEKQYLKMKSRWTGDILKETLANYSYTKFELTDQFRMIASEEMVQWVDDFVARQINPFPDAGENFEFQVISNPEAFKQYIRDKNDEVGLSRIVSTFDYEHKKNGGTFYVDEEGINMPWNTTNSKITWSERPETIDEVGSIYTVQGFDLNYVGVVLGPSVDYDFDKDQIILDVRQYKDIGALTGANSLATEEERIAAKEQIILNSINILMKRGIHGLALYAVNENLRKKLLMMQEEAKHND